MMTVKELLIRQAIYLLLAAVISGGVVLLHQRDEGKMSAAQSAASMQFGSN